jgi:hypothetical protein
MKFQKAISFIFHPILLPFAGTLYYFLITPIIIPKTAQLRIILLILTITYIIPVLMLFLLKKTKKIDNYRIDKIEQRKRPILFITLLFSILSWMLFKIPQLNDLAKLFIGNVAGLLIMNVIFNWGIKTSIHMLGIGTVIGFMAVFSYKYQINMLTPLMILFTLAGLIGQSRLYLKAHNSQEIVIGMLLGIITQIFTYFL